VVAAAPALAGVARVSGSRSCGWVPDQSRQHRNCTCCWSSSLGFSSDICRGFTSEPSSSSVRSSSSGRRLCTRDSFCSLGFSCKRHYSSTVGSGGLVMVRLSPASSALSSSSRRWWWRCAASAYSSSSSGGGGGGGDRRVRVARLAAAVATGMFVQQQSRDRCTKGWPTSYSTNAVRK
jgi:hypothetical protein